MKANRINQTKLPPKIVALAKAEVGTREIGNSNCGRRVNEYKSATKLPPKESWPWCAAFVDWIIMKSMETGGPYTFDRPTTAGAWAIEDWSLDQDSSTNTKNHPEDDINPGDIVIFKFSHVGFAIDEPKDGYVSTIEGNTDATGTRDGGGVWTKFRKLSQIKTRIRFTV